MKILLLLCMCVLSIIACKDTAKENTATVVENTKDIDTAHYDNMSIEEKNTPLFDASSSGQIEAVKSLVENGADVDANSLNGVTALIEASKHGYFEIVKYLVDNGADVNIKSRQYYYTALIFASRYGHLDVVKYLVENGADIDAKSKGGRTALSNALYNEHSEIIEYLKSKGATE